VIIVTDYHETPSPTGNRFVPIFPPTQAGNFRLPFDHPEVEAVGQICDALYRLAPLREGERSAIIRAHMRLEEADLHLFSRFGEAQLPATSVRPRKPQRTLMETREDWELTAGYVARVRDFLEALLDRYDLWERCGIRDDRPV
jgi:hypothetical protein